MHRAPCERLAAVAGAAAAAAVLSAAEMVKEAAGFRSIF
jgi:hypothetical protein